MQESMDGFQIVSLIPTAGVNEVAAVTQLPIGSFVSMVNFRPAKEGRRLEKRNGLEVVADLSAGSSPIYGYATYYDGSSNFCQIAVTGAKIWRKVGSGSWTAIHTWSSAITHPVPIHEIHGRIYVLTEIQNKMILADGTVVQCGISAPATIPTIAAAYDTSVLAEDFAVITDWTSGDTGAGVSSQATFGGKSCLRLLNTGATADAAKRYRTVAGLAPEYSFEFEAYFNTLDTVNATNHFQINIYNGRILFQIRIDKNDIYVQSGLGWVSAAADIIQDRWLSFKVFVDSSEVGEEYCEIFLNDDTLGEFICNQLNTGTPGLTELVLYGKSSATDVYLDYFNMGNVSGGNLNGRFRYAVAYERPGNYGDVSNPIKSLIGAVSFVAGTPGNLNDMTVTGTYTGEKTKTIRVQIDGVGTPNTFKWSDDAGNTWNSTAIYLGTTNDLPWGIVLNWAATTGHTSGDYWEFIASAMSAVAVHQKVSLSSLPVSTDPQVTQKIIYRSSTGGTKIYYQVAKIPNAVTAFVDNIEDDFLGEVMKEDRDIAPLGKFSVWWDDRLWIANAGENMVYHSDIGYPEAFSLAKRYTSVKMGKVHDELTGIVPYGQYLYPFKKKSIYVIRKKASGAYGRNRILGDFGCIAPWSFNEAFGLLTFMSYRGWEVFNGEEGYPSLFSVAIEPTIKTTDPVYYDRLVSITNSANNEIWLSIPNRLAGAAAITAVCNYGMEQCFYYFQFHKTPSWFVEAEDSTGAMCLYMGTTDGYVFKCETGTQDGTTNISARARTSWLKFEIPQNARLIEYEYEAPTGNNWTVNLYGDMQVAAVRTMTLAGDTPSTTDQSIRKPIDGREEVQALAKYISIEFVNAENVGSALKMNALNTFVAETHRKNAFGPD
jgi:hypothetical protein